MKILKEILSLAIPIMIGQVAHVLMGIGDSVVAARHDTTTLAAVGVANGIVLPGIFFGVGVLSAVSALISRKYRNLDMTNIAKSSLAVSLFLSILIGSILYFLSVNISIFAIEEKLIEPVQSYLNIIIFSLIPTFGFQALREVEQGQERVVFSNFLLIASVLCNVILNMVLVLGFFGLKSFGIEGLAFASCIAKLFIFLILLRKSNFLGKFHLDEVKEILRFGFPIWLMFFAEVLAFSLVAVVAGQYGVVEAAANNIIFNLASFSFVIPQSVSWACAVLIGVSIANKNYLKGKQIIFSACLFSFLYAIFTSGIYFIFPHVLLSFFTDDYSVLVVAQSMLIIVAIFQIVDSMQVTLAGIIRGLGDTKNSFIFVLLAYWILGLPLGHYLGAYRNLGMDGYWIGLAIAIGILSFGFFFLMRKNMMRIMHGAKKN